MLKCLCRCITFASKFLFYAYFYLRFFRESNHCLHQNKNRSLAGLSTFELAGIGIPYQPHKNDQWLFFAEFDIHFRYCLWWYINYTSNNPVFSLQKRQHSINQPLFVLKCFLIVDIWGLRINFTANWTSLIYNFLARGIGIQEDHTNHRDTKCYVRVCTEKSNWNCHQQNDE